MNSNNSDFTLEIKITGKFKRRYSTHAIAWVGRKNGLAQYNRKDFSLRYIESGVVECVFGPMAFGNILTITEDAGKYLENGDLIIRCEVKFIIILGNTILNY